MKHFSSAILSKFPVSGLRSLASCLVLACFCLWIIPLGVFIKPANEQKTCGGKRAICLCSHMAEKSSGNANKINLLNHGGVHKEEASSGGSGGHFILTALKRIDPLATSRFLHHTANPYSLIVCKSIEHIPKV